MVMALLVVLYLIIAALGFGWSALELGGALFITTRVPFYFWS